MIHAVGSLIAICFIVAVCIYMSEYIRLYNSTVSKSIILAGNNLDINNIGKNNDNHLIRRRNIPHRSFKCNKKGRTYTFVKEKKLDNGKYEIVNYTNTVPCDMLIIDSKILWCPTAKAGS